MKNNKRIFVFWAFLGICFYLVAENPKIKELVDEKYYEKLVKDGSITIYRDDGSSEYLLLPKSEYSEQINKCKIQKLQRCVQGIIVPHLSAVVFAWLPIIITEVESVGGFDDFLFA